MQTFAALKNNLFFGILFLLCIASTSDTNYAGEWTLNEQKSKMGENRGRMISKKIKVSQEANSMTIERTSTNRNGEPTTITDKLTLDGKEIDGEGGGNSTRKLNATWSADGKSVIINTTRVFSRDGTQREVKTTETWRLSEENKILTIDVASTSSMGNTTMTLVYDKAN